MASSKLVLLFGSAFYPTFATATDVDTLAVKLAELSDPIVVVGERGGYDEQSTQTATKTETPLKNVPQAVSIVTAQQIADQGMRSIADVLRAVPGASVASGEGHRDQILLRGQNTTADFFVDGIRDDVQYYRGLYNLDRVEVLKGPNAMIFGRGGGGGVVNRVTKKAVDVDFVAGSASVDTHGGWTTDADINRRLSSRAAARLNAGYEWFDSFRDHVDGYRVGINPTTGWNVDADTRIDLSYEYSHDRRVVDRGIPSRDGRPMDDAQDQFFGDPAVNQLRFDAHVVDLSAQHLFSDVLRWSGKARYGSYDKFYRNSLAATPVAGGMVGIEAYQSVTRRDGLFVQNDLVAEVNGGRIAHTLLAGVDFGRQETFSDRQQGFFDGAPEAIRNSRRLFVPIDATDDLPLITFRNDPVQPATAGDTNATAWGIYAQDQAKIGEYIEIVAGLRRDWFKLDHRDRVHGTRLGRKDALWSPRLGLVLKPTQTLSLYGSWSKSFLPQSGDQFSSLSATTESLRPEKFINREIGLKWTARPGFDVTLAGYVLDRTNTRATDPVTLLPVLSGEQRSKGIEATATGKLGKHISIAAAAAVQKAVITETTQSAVEGTRVPSVPRFTGSLWGRYDVNDRLGFGLGIYRQSKTYASVSNSVEVPGYTRIDAAAFVGLSDQLGLQLNLENVLDKDYVAAVHTDNNLTPGNPRTARAALRLKF